MQHQPSTVHLAGLQCQAGSHSSCVFAVLPCLVPLFTQSHISFSSSPKGSSLQPSLLDSPLPATTPSAATLSTSPASSTGSSSAAAAAAAKLSMGSGASAMSAHLRAKGGAEGPLSPQDAANLMLECVYEFNACVPYAGVSAVGAGEGFELEPLAVTAVLALLPEELQPGLPPPALAPDDVKQVRKVLLLHAYTFLTYQAVPLPFLASVRCKCYSQFAMLILSKLLCG